MTEMVCGTSSGSGPLFGGGEGEGGLGGEPLFLDARGGEGGGAGFEEIRDPLINKIDLLSGDGKSVGSGNYKQSHRR